MSTKLKDTVWVSRETAETALTELNYMLEYADERETGGERAAIDDLWHALDDDGPRTTVASSGEFDTLAIAGVSEGTVVIDYGQTPPRVVITADGDEAPAVIIELPTNEADDTKESDSSPETITMDDSSNGGEY